MPKLAGHQRDCVSVFVFDFTCLYCWNDYVFILVFILNNDDTLRFFVHRFRRYYLFGRKPLAPMVNHNNIIFFVYFIIKPFEG